MAQSSSVRSIDVIGRTKLTSVPLHSIFAEMDCLLSLAKASADLDEPRCRPELVESDEAFIDFRDLRHPALCLRSDFISNDVQLGLNVPRQTLLTGPST
jgi:DNA mismatch repair protein MSH6